MKIHFAASTSKIEQLGNVYLSICSLIEKLGHEITRDWVKDAIKITKSKKRDLERGEVYEEVVKSILSCDLVIAEGTVASFSLGHQITLALSKGKPVIFLRNKSFRQEKRFTNDFVDGIKNPLLSIFDYCDDDLLDIINDFINKNGASPSIKFNIVLTREIENYLDWASYTYKVNKSEFIRNIIHEHMSKLDKKYAKFTKNKYD